MKQIIPPIALLLVLFSCQLTSKQTTEHTTSLSSEAIKTYYVAPIKANCESEGSQSCLLVKRKMSDRWTLFYEPIKGFRHEWGHTYIIKVKESKRNNTPADASSLQFELIEIVEKNKTEQEFINLYDIYGIIKIDGQQINQEVFQSLELNTKEMTFMGEGGCNSFKGKIKQTENWNGISFIHMISTKKACPNLTQEDKYLNALRSVTGFYRYNNTLLLFAGQEPVIEARRID